MTFALIALLLWAAAAAGSGLPSDGLQSASRQIEETMDRLSARWAVHEFPVFLKTAWMLEDGYQLMKDRLRLKLASSLSGAAEESFVVSFTGSSVTAGHDSPFNMSYPMLTSDLMKPVLASVGVDLVIRDAAMGNNPCMPYDVCVRTFAGEDADVVVWEQSYNCHPSTKGHLFEQFVRQAMLMPSHPLVVFSDSETPNWQVSQCINVSTKAIPLAVDQQLLLKAKAEANERHIYTALNKGNERHWGKLIMDFMGRYKAAGVQTFLHKYYEGSKCKGPYVPEWKGRNVMWHPSLLGHEVRAAHFSYVWLSILRDAIEDLRRGLPAGDAQAQRSRLADTLRDMCGQSSREGLPTCRSLAQTAAARPAEGPVGGPQQWSPLLPAPLFNSVNLTDGLQCYTEYQPRPNDDMSLQRRVVSNNVLPPDRPGTMPYIEGWTKITFEYIYMPHLVNKTSAAGYLDFKVILYGNNVSKSLDILIHVSKIGKLYFCDVPSIPTKMQTKFHVSLSVSNLRLYLSEVSKEEIVGNQLPSFRLNKETARDLSYFGGEVHKDDTRCIQTEEALRPGDYVVSIEPQDLMYVVIATVVVP